MEIVDREGMAGGKGEACTKGKTAFLEGFEEAVGIERAENAGGEEQSGRGLYEASGVEIEGEKAPKKRGRPGKTAASEGGMGPIAPAAPQGGEEGLPCRGKGTESPPTEGGAGQFPGGRTEKAAACDGEAALQTEGTPKKRGRPRKAPDGPEAGPKKRGRPGKSPSRAGAREAACGERGEEDAWALQQEADICGAAFRRQGRPPKNGWKQEQLLQGEAINGAWETVARLLLEGEMGMPIRQIAKEAKISRDMVYRYLKDEGFNRYLDALIDEEIKGCEAAIWRTLKGMCLSGDLQAIKYYFELRGRREKEVPEEKGAVVQIIDDVPDLSMEELKEIYGPLAGEELNDDG